MKSDTFSIIGHTHKNCEDYIVLGTDSLFLCDGCSSSANSDVGARIFAHTTEMLRPTDMAGWNAVLENCSVILNRLNLPIDALSATLMWLESFEDAGYVKLNWVGDGTVVVRNKATQELEIETIEFKSNAPYYLRYHLGDKEGWLEMFGDTYNDERSYFKDFPNGIITRNYDTSIYDLFAVFSDGIKSFVDMKGQNPLSVHEVVSKFLSIKGFSGDFAQRRGMVAINEIYESGYLNYDDVTVGVMKL